MAELLTRFSPKVIIDDFEHSFKHDGTDYKAGLKEAKLGNGVLQPYVVFGHLYIDQPVQIEETQVRTPRLFNPFHVKIIPAREERKRLFDQLIGIYSEKSNKLIERVMSMLLRDKELELKREDAETIILPIWEHYQPLLDAANTELEDRLQELLGPTSQQDQRNQQEGSQNHY